LKKPKQLLQQVDAAAGKSRWTWHAQDVAFEAEKLASAGVIFRKCFRDFIPRDKPTQKIRRWIFPALAVCLKFLELSATESMAIKQGSGHESARFQICRYAANGNRMTPQRPAELGDQFDAAMQQYGQGWWIQEHQRGGPDALKEDFTGRSSLALDSKAGGGSSRHYWKRQAGSSSS